MGRSVRFFVGLAFLALWQSQVAAQPTFHSRTELVSLNVSVTDEESQHVKGLKAEQFEVFENGVQQEVRFFAPGEMPLDVVVLLDTSASMRGSMPLVKQAATRFARALRSGDRASVMGISNGLRVLQTFTEDIGAVERAINSASTGGKTPLYASIYTALRELEKIRDVTQPRRQAVVVLSDGQDTSSAFSFDELMNIVHRHAVPIYAIAPRATKSVKAAREQIFGETTHLADFELKKLASETGGRSFFPVSGFELSGVYDDIAKELSNQYSLGYQSSNTQDDGSFRRISLKINVPGLRWRTRAGYLAERSAANEHLDH